MPEKKKKTESEKLHDFGKFVGGIVKNIESEIAKGRAKIKAESVKVDPIPDTVSALLGLRPGVAPSAASRAQKRVKKPTVRRK